MGKGGRIGYKERLGVGVLTRKRISSERGGGEKTLLLNCNVDIFPQKFFLTILNFVQGLISITY